MDSVGSQIREARLKLGLTIEQVSANTRISTKNLQAIEDDDLSRSSSAFFYKSFVRQFAEHVGLDFALLAPAVQQAAGTLPEPLLPGQSTPGRKELFSVKVEALPVKRPRNLRWLSSVASLFVMLVACSGLYSLWQTSRSTWSASLSRLVHRSTPSSRPSAAAPDRPMVTHATQPAPAAPTEAAVNPISPESAAETDDSFRIELSALERTWLSIADDGKEVFSGILDAADTKVFDLRDIARIRTGNAGGISFVLNGKPIGTLGPRGQVRTVLFTKNNYEVLEPPAHIALTSFNPNGE